MMKLGRPVVLFLWYMYEYFTFMLYLSFTEDIVISNY